MAHSEGKDKQYFYSSIADQFDELQDSYDLERRKEIIFSTLIDINIKRKKYLEVGCGTGNLLYKPAKKGAVIFAVDIAFELLLKAKSKIDAQYICADALFLPFADSCFDVVVSSDVIEHTINPYNAALELSRLIHEKGWLVITTPNNKWQWAIDLSEKLGINKFHGIENFPDFIHLEKILISNGLLVNKHIGFHPWPFQLRFLRPFSRYIDNHFGGKKWGRIMINQALIASKTKEK